MGDEILFTTCGLENAFVRSHSIGSDTCEAKQNPPVSLVAIL